MKSLGGFIKERREAKDWSKRRLATEAEISHTEVHRIENGERKNPSVPVLNALAVALDVPSEELLQIAGYINEESDAVPFIERAFPALKTEKQQQTVQKIVDGLARNSDLEEDDYDDLVDQMEMFLAHAKKKKNSR